MPSQNPLANSDPTPVTNAKLIWAFVGILAVVFAPAVVAVTLRLI